jgi:general secretion pathway protein B
VAGPAPAAQPAPAPEAPIPRLSDLPESMRREMPKLTISGSVYSDDPASRFVMINGEVAREGAKLGADLVLEQIGPRELVLRFKGQRYRQPI